MALLYGRAGRLTAKNGGFWPGQILGDDSLESGCDGTATVRHAFAVGAARMPVGAVVVVTERPPPRADMTDEEIEGLVKLADESGDGVINLQEFVELVEKYTKE